MNFKEINILILIFAFNLFSNVMVSTNKNEVMTGDRLKLSFEISYPKNAVIDISGIQNYSSQDFELIKSSPESKNELDGTTIEMISNEYITFAAAGEHFLGPFKFSYVISEETNNYTTDSIKVVVHSILKGSVSYIDSTGQQAVMPLDSLKMILPIKDIVEYKLSATEKKYIVSFFLLLIVVIVLIYLFLKRKRNGAEVIEQIEKIIKIPAHVIAYGKLEELKKKNYLQKGIYKEFAAELSLITRIFLEDRFNFPAAELPTDELKEKIINYIQNGSILKGMDKLLEITDFVKFAKFIPLEAELKSFLEFTYEVVDELKENVS